MTTELITTSDRKRITELASNLIGCNVSKLFDLLRKQWPQKGEQFSDLELFQAVSMIARYQLDPLTREIYCSRDKGGRILVTVGIDGWIKILHRLPGYDGHEQEIEWDDKGNPVSCTTTIYSKLKSHPIRYTGYWAEYVRVGGFMRDTLPSHMLRIFSLRHAARQFAPIGGNVVTEEEARYMVHHEPEDDEPVDTRANVIGNLDATLVGKVGCETDEDKLAVVEWALGHDVSADGLDSLTETEASDVFSQLVHFTNPDGDFRGSWEHILPLARGEELVEA